MGNIIQIQRKRPEQGLNSLNRLTGLDFDRWPQSLLTNGPVHGGPVTGGTGAATLSASAPSAPCSADRRQGQ